MSVSFSTYLPAHLSALVAFLNRVLAGHRHWAPITEADFIERVLEQPAFDPKGLFLAWHEDEVVGGAHAIKPLDVPISPMQEPRHHIAWLAVAPEHRAAAPGRAPSHRR